MGRILVIAEKPSVGRDIARVLGCKGRGMGCMHGDDYVITWAIGHLVALASPEELDPKYQKWNLADLPILPPTMKLKVLERVQRQFDIVQEWMNSDEIDSLICATDSGREGELIFRLIYEMAGCTKPFQRLWISSMTDDAITEGFQNLRPGSDYDNLFASARCRSEADWLVGMNGSRAYSVTYDTRLSVGRVQSPTLALITQREKERLAFVPETYWELQATFHSYKGTWFDPKAEKDATHITADKIDRIRKIVETLKGQPATVVSVETKEEAIKPPLLYDLTELQRDANRRFGWPASKTLRVAQSLYEKRKVITYPRTDSRYLSRDLVKTLKTRLAKFQRAPWQPFADEAMESTRNLFGRVINDARVTDHHAIIPTGRAAEGKGWSDDEKALFDLVVRRYISIFLPDQVAKITTAVTEAAGESFISHGRNLLQEGWSAIYAPLAAGKRAPKSEVADDFPELHEGMPRKVTSCKMKEKKTQPPSAYTEAMLLSAMEHAGRVLEDEELRLQMADSGLGTPATRAAIIERLIQVGYVRRAGRILKPTPKGMALVEILPDSLSSAETTGRWEKGLAEIGRGERDAAAFMKEIRELTCAIVEDGRVKKVEVDFPEEGISARDPGAEKVVLGTCPLCGGNILENSKGFYCHQWRSRGCRFTLWKQQKGDDARPVLGADQIRNILETGLLEFPEGRLELQKTAPFYIWTPHGDIAEDK